MKSKYLIISAILLSFTFYTSQERTKLEQQQSKKKQSQQQLNEASIVMMIIDNSLSTI